MNNSQAYTLISHLRESYENQLSLYTELIDNGQKMINALLLNRTQVSSLTALFEKKQALVDSIEKERHRIHDETVAWQQIKSSIERSPEVEQLNALLENIEKALQKFLTNEDHLRLHLEKFFGVSSGEKSV